ncbi:hypothetical protein IQ06DRAFT_371994 [Phaeosphaeriaceae sp. SRC1lsM3a]|nr:hypothetical protein IQ06DRAFT_371994 [Stagonospora sp. SRC1lsM3a]
MVRRPRVQFRGPPAKKNKRTDRARPNQFSKPMSLMSQQSASKQPQIESVLDSETATTANEEPLVEIEGIDNQQTGSEVFIIPKITLPLKVPHGKEGGNHVGAQEFHASIAPIRPPLKDSWFESPPASWVKLAPIFDRRRVPLLPSPDANEFPSFFDSDHETPQPSQSPPTSGSKHATRTSICGVVCEVVSEPTSELASKPAAEPALELASEPSESARSTLQVIIELFTRRKKRGNAMKQKATTGQGPPRINSDTSSDQSGPASISDWSPTTEPSQPSPACFRPPLLTHAQVFPTVVKPIPCKLHRPCVYITPAPPHIDNGKVFSAEDLYRADIVHRGFETRGSANYVVIEYKRNHSAGQLLDREGDMWANWYAKCNTVDSNPSHHMCGSML